MFLTRDISTGMCPKDVNDELSKLSSAFLGIFLLISGGGFLRLLCYRTLGKFFTYEITIRSNHKIVDVGPYAIVRHPSYTGLFMMFFGSGFLMFGSPSPITICGWAASFGFVKVFMGIWTLWAVIFSCWILNRVHVEEGNLSRHFGKAWDDYIRRVPYRYIPMICWLYIRWSSSDEHIWLSMNVRRLIESSKMVIRKEVWIICFPNA